MTAEEIIGGLLEREDGWRDEVRRPNGTVDPATNRGITLPTLRQWRARRGLKTTLEDLRNLTADEARAIYQSVYVVEPGFVPANVPYEPLRVQLIDFGVNSGTGRAIRWLQRVLRAPVTGQMDWETVEILQGLAGIGPVQALAVELPRGVFALYALALVNDALVAARSYMIDRAVDTGSMRKADEEGVESRALSFFLARPQ